MSANDNNTLPPFAVKWTNLAAPALGAEALYASDDFFAPKERLLSAPPAVFIPGKYDLNGKWMDGWESRRKRRAGHDYCVIRLGLPGVIKGFDIDTSHFTGNYPQAASIDACLCEEGDPSETTVWTALLPATKLSGNSHHYLEIDDARAWSHVRLNIYPDGGVARLRVYGQVACDWSNRSNGDLHDLIAVENGGRAIAWNDAHFGKPLNLLTPGRGKDMGDGWETRRRREPGNDWTIIALGHPGVISRIEVDTAHFKGNYPDRCSIQGALVGDIPDEALIAQSMFWPVLLPEQPLSMDAIHNFAAEIANIGLISHIRFNIVPDGGVSRLRLFGHPNKD
ncbi:MAG TPA: allantoicase [Burkholderiales bacterium]|nr:allantoicase [Burkholderiales bacterium]